MLDLASRYVKFEKDTKYDKVIEYAYRMLLQNQAHDSICGCSTDDVHSENIIRYKKIKQIGNTIIDELKLKNNFEERKILNLSGETYSGVIEFNSAKPLEGYDKLFAKKGFDPYLLTNTQRIPVTEDHQYIYTYMTEVENIKPDVLEYLSPAIRATDLKITNTSLENSNLSLQVVDKNVYINGIKLSLVDFTDLGDSYNNGPKADDKGVEYSVLRTKILLNTPTRVSLRIDFEGAWDVIPLVASLDKHSTNIKLKFDWVNSQKNHLLEVKFGLSNPIQEVFSEDMNLLIKRNFDPNYDIRKNLPDKRGIEARTNTAPMQRGLLIDEQGNNIGVVTKGLTQYEVFENNLYIPILRATGVISNPQNPARSTPAGPPLEVESLQQIGNNSAEMYVFFGNQNAFWDTIKQVYNYIIV